jgi:hypothetical protein
MTARNIIAEAAYGSMKHRVGHGIGIKGKHKPALIED